jgi:hypothetical protein
MSILSGRCDHDTFAYQRHLTFIYTTVHTLIHFRADLYLACFWLVSDLYLAYIWASNSTT